MKKKTTPGVAMIGMLILSTAAVRNETYTVDPKLSSLEWTGKKLGGEHSGTIRLSSGTLEWKNDIIKGGKFEIDMTSIENTDLTGEWKAKLEGHLKSPDFFDVAGFPKAAFVINSVTPLKTSGTHGATHTIKGNLTIKGKTNPLSFDAVISHKDHTLFCIGTAVVDRSKYDVKFGSKSFFTDLGDKIIYDEFTLKFNVTAKQ